MACLPETGMREAREGSTLTAVLLSKNRGFGTHKEAVKNASFIPSPYGAPTAPVKQHTSGAR